MDHVSSSGEVAVKIYNCDSWYYHDIKHLPEPTRQLFEEYSGIPSEQVLDHIQHMRSRAFAIYPYPCIGQLRFLNLSLSNHPLYPEVISRLRHQHLTGELQSLSIDGQYSGISYQHQIPQTFLDLGCCLAQDLRKLVYDGASPHNLYGLDVERKFIELSYELFRDADTLKSQFVIDDMLRTDAEEVDLQVPQNAKHNESVSPPNVVPLASLEGRVSIIAANSFLHLYDYSDQLKLAKRIERLLSPE
ncbi:MAG: hypothetical protein Q9191_006328, partial [Dirinaria sp. TL-2023a]